MTQPIPPFCDLAAPGVQVLQPYHPGKPMAELEREYGVSDVVKLASNENPLGPSPRALVVAREVLSEVHRYPDGNGFELKAALAEHHDVAPETITLGSGSNDCLDLIARTFLAPGRQAVYSAHGFAVYPIATLSAGATPVAAPALGADSDAPFGHDLDAMAKCIGERTRVVFVANPNNPTGTWIDTDTLGAFLERVPRDVLVVLDEAYFEYAVKLDGYPDATRWLNEFPNLIVARTFSKAYGLAGLRVGYCLSHPDVAELLNRVRLPFNVNHVAQAAAVAALQDQAHIDASVELNERERTRLAAELGELALPIIHSAGNFIAVEVGERADAIYDELLRRGVIVRPIGGYQMPRHLRVSIGLETENDRFLVAMRELVAQGLAERGA